MTVSSDFGGLGGGGARFDNYRTRNANGSIRYPSPFFDISHTYLPTTVKQMFRWCRYYFLINPVINAITYKMAEYPITPLVVDEPDEDLRKKWEKIISNQLRLRSFQVEVGLDYFAYGNAFVTIHFPFIKWLQCANCDKEVRITKADYKYRNNRYELLCSECHVTTQAKVHDRNIKDIKGIRLLRWNPENITVEHNEITGETAYFYEIPMAVRNDITIGKRHIIETIPDIFIESIRQSKTLRLVSDNLFHFKRPTIAEKDMGWGMPLLLPVMKDAYYLQILRKAQEVIAQGHIVPLKMLFPQAAGASADPFNTTDLGTWRRRMERELEKWRLDPNYMPIMPLPVGNETIGGEGKALMLHQEMRAWTEQMIAGMQVPIEFFFGGLSYSGSNMSMRMLENQFLKYRNEQHILCQDFILGKIANYMGWKRPEIHFKRFKMADDLQRLGVTIQLNQMQKVSDTTLLDEFDYDLSSEEKHKKEELAKQLDNQRHMQLAQADLQGQVMVTQAKYQAQVQKLMAAMGVPPAPGSGPELPDVSQMGLGQPQPGGGAGDGSQQPMDGSQAAPGMPEGASVYPENAGEAPTEGVPSELLSPLMEGQQQGGMNVLYLARRAATYLGKLDEASKYVEMMKLRANPQLYQLVLQLMQKELGAQTNPTDPLQMPLPEVKPPRRDGFGA